MQSDSNAAVAARDIVRFFRNALLRINGIERSVWHASVIAFVCNLYCLERRLSYDQEQAYLKVSSSTLRPKKTLRSPRKQSFALDFALMKARDKLATALFLKC